MQLIRSWLFVPGDSEAKLQKARGSEADALIIDLEDSVADSRQDAARGIAGDFLKRERDRSAQALWVRVNPLDHHFSMADLCAVMAGAPDGIVLPKVSSAHEIGRLSDFLSALEVREGLQPGSTKILSIATETAAALLNFRSYLEFEAPRLTALTWGGEDLAAALGARSNRHPSTGEYDQPYLFAQTMCLAAAKAIDAVAVGAVVVDFRNLDALAADCARERNMGFFGKAAIHPAQCGVINAAYTATADELEHAQRIVDLFAANPGSGTIGVEGKMYDMPHLKQAKHVIALAGEQAMRGRGGQPA